MNTNFSPTPGKLVWKRSDGRNLSRNCDTSSKPNTLTFTNIMDENEGEYQCYPTGNQTLAARIILLVDGMYDKKQQLCKKADLG